MKSFCRKKHKKNKEIEMYLYTNKYEIQIEALIFSMTDLYLPSIFVPLVGLVFPAVSIAFLFVYVQKNNIV